MNEADRWDFNEFQNWVGFVLGRDLDVKSPLLVSFLENIRLILQQGRIGKFSLNSGKHRAKGRQTNKKKNEKKVGEEAVSEEKSDSGQEQQQRCHLLHGAEVRVFVRDLFEKYSTVFSEQVCLNIHF